MTDGETLDAVIALIECDGEQMTDGETLAEILVLLSKWAEKVDRVTGVVDVAPWGTVLVAAD